VQHVVTAFLPYVGNSRAIIAGASFIKLVRLLYRETVAATSASELLIDVKTLQCVAMGLCYDFVERVIVIVGHARPRFAASKYQLLPSALIVTFLIAYQGEL